MRILHTSDWHLGRNLEHISRIDEQREFIDCLCGIVEEQKIELILVAGDIFDTYNPSAAAEELFYYAMERLNGNGARPVVVIAGNHDNPDRLCAASPLAYRNGIIILGYPGSDAGAYEIASDKIKIIDSGPGWMELSINSCDHNTVIITLPYPSESRLEELLTRHADEDKLQKAYSEKVEGIFSILSQKFRSNSVNLIIGHLFLRGSKESDSERTLQVGGAMTVDPCVLPENAHFAAFGHLHRPQEVKSAPCPVFYSGSPLAYSFSESDYAKAVYIINAIPGEKALIQPVYLECGKPLKKWVANEGIHQALRWCEEARDLNAWVDLEIVTDRILTFEEQKHIRNLHPGIINLRPRLNGNISETIDPYSREGRKIDELFADYYKYKLGVDIPKELMTAFLDVINDEDHLKSDAVEGDDTYET